MSSIITSQGAVFATAMAVSGTVILLALRLQKSLPPTQFSLHEIPSSSSPTPILRSCISSDEKKTKKKKKRVHFAEDVMDSCKDGEEYRKQHQQQQQQQHGTNNTMNNTKHSLKINSKSKVSKNCNGGNENRGMPANRVALYNGILRDRVNQRLGYC
ncbi:uncharacterized protein LOC123921799 [Trifolium pratense]|uniref:uncharacterized protein LOC123921799 n=1 Tax=Trifolium pratense TaxID=57577 RepID=UPI001E690480|nr:uncharacterized protein LOC123921799 [Trifolium pratense]